MTNSFEDIKHTTLSERGALREAARFVQRDPRQIVCKQHQIIIIDVISRSTMLTVQLIPYYGPSLVFPDVL